MLSQENMAVINSEIFNGIEMKGAVEAGDAYQHLCKAFPLRAISSKTHHQAALAVIEKTMIFLSTHSNNRALCKDVEGYLEALSTLVESYEKKKYPDVGSNASPIDVLKYLMSERGFLQKDIAKAMGGQPNASAILKGKRELNARQIAALSKLFNISPAVFF